MKRKPLTRRDFLKLAGVGTAVVLPTALGLSVYHSALGEYPIVSNPYIETVHTAKLDGSVPILLIVNKDSDNPFGIYFTEILRAEGLNCFHTTDLSTLEPASLEKYDIVILAETPLNVAQAEILKGYVARGGRLIGMKPDERLAPIFGVESAAGSVSEGYIKTDPNNPASNGINPSTMQFHGMANQYRLANAQSVAWLFTDRDTSTKYPAIALNKFGNGMTVLFAFDLAKSVANMRQGNPALSDQDLDGHPFIRATDMFVDWIDLNRIAIPQADEQQRLFVNLIYELTKDLTPLPRLWYFPFDLNALIIATGDAHPISGAEAIDNVLKRVERRGGHMSIYYSFTLHDDLYRFAQRGRFCASKLPFARNLLDARFKTPTPDQVSEWRARGHEFTLHPHVGTDMCGGFSADGFVAFDNLEDGWKTYWQQFTGLGYKPVSPTVRTHCVLWRGWVETARIQASYGIRMNLDYYHVGPAFRKGNGDWAYGHFTGSGLPMKFIDEQGRLLNIYQQLTQLADENFFSFPEIGWVDVGNYTAEAALEVSRDLMQSSYENDFPTAFCVQFHPDPFAYGGRPAEIAERWLEGTLDYAVENDIPIWSAQDWLRFTQTRQDARVFSIDWDEKNLALRFGVEVKHGTEKYPISDLALNIPAKQMKARLGSIQIDGSFVEPGERQIGGIHYFTIPVSSGTHQVVVRYMV